MHNSPTEEIKQRLDIVEVIGAHLPLKRSGVNFVARCPFHSEKTPSFNVSPSKQMWYCFGACQEGGDMFNFVMKMEGLDFKDALKLLADKAGVVLPEYDKNLENRRGTLLAIVKEAAAKYAAELKGARGSFARDYLKRRGLTDAVIERFGLGYAPDAWDTLTLALRDKFKAEDVFAAGLIIKRARSHNDPDNLQLTTYNLFYDRFRHRIIFPIRDVHGQVLGFTSRLLDESRQEGKYVNTPETPIYQKGRVLYGLDLAREAIRKAGYAVLAEGNMDVIGCHQFGYTNTVASSGTALTLDQVRLLKRYAGNVKIAFDADPAGQNAAKRGIDLALAEGMRIKVIVIPKDCGKDPDECVRNDAKIWEGAVRGASEIMEYYIVKGLERFDIKTAPGRSQFTSAILPEVARLPDLVEQDFWLKKIGEELKIDERILREQMKREVTKSTKRLSDEERNTDLIAQSLKRPMARPRLDLLSERLMMLFLADPRCADKVIANIFPEMLSPAAYQALYTQLVRCYNDYNSIGSPLTGANFRQFWRDWAKKQASDSLSTGDILEMRGEKEFDKWQAPQFNQEANFLIINLRREYLRGLRQTLASKMKQAEIANNRETVAELTREFEELRAQEIQQQELIKGTA